MLKTKEYKITQAVAHIVCLFFTLCALLPFILLVVGSFTDNSWAVTNGFTFFPTKWSINAYQYIVEKWAVIGRAYMMTLAVTGIGTFISLLISTMFAYGISKSHIPGMKLVSFLLIFTMLFNGGLVSTYYCYIKLYHIKNTFAALVVPGLLMNAFNVILIRNYFINSIPISLEEAARIDGANEFLIFSRIIMPLSKPIIATVGLMAALAYWNDWQNGLYYLSDIGGSQFYTIQIVLNNINDDVRALVQTMTSGSMGGMSTSIADIPTTTMRMAIAVIGILPILVLYPFFQKYFVKGITLVGVKE